MHPVVVLVFGSFSVACFVTLLVHGLPVNLHFLMMSFVGNVFATVTGWVLFRTYRSRRVPLLPS